MIERHKDELAQALPEVDLFLGSSEMQRLIPELSERGLLGTASEELHPGCPALHGRTAARAIHEESAKAAITAALSARSL